MKVDDIYKAMKRTARKIKRKIVVCEGWDQRCLEAADKILKTGDVELVLLDNGQVMDNAEKHGYDIEGAVLVDYKNYDGMDELVFAMVELRKHKGLTPDDARKLLEDENYFACMYVHCGHADGLVGSKICPTASLMRPALQLLRQKGKLVSEVAITYVKKLDRIIAMTDFSMNIDPSPEDLSKIADNAVHLVKGLGIEPKVAFLSFSTAGSGGTNLKTEAVRKAVELSKEKMPDVVVDGEMQFDAAINPYAASRKCPDSAVKGEANVLVFPDLNSANIFGHTMFQLIDQQVVLTMSYGLRHPVGILGRSTPTEHVVNIIYAAAMECNME